MPDSYSYAVMYDVHAELAAAILAYPSMNSAHEGYAVILEELEELWELVREKQTIHRKQAMRKEAIQVAAMAMRFVMDVCDAE